MTAPSTLLAALPGVAVEVRDDALANEWGIRQLIGTTSGEVCVIIAPYLVAEPYQPGDSRPLFCDRCKRVTRHDWRGGFVCRNEHIEVIT
jgi:hypothetical protein